MGKELKSNAPTRAQRRLSVVIRTVDCAAADRNIYLDGLQIRKGVYMDGTPVVGSEEEEVARFPEKLANAGPAELQNGGVVRPNAVGPLAGVRVLDLCIAVAGPFSAAILAELGADVIKIESLRQPDGQRTAGTAPVTNATMPAMVNGAFVAVARGKRSLVLDLSLPEGKEIFMRLAAKADVIVQNFRPGAVARLGVDYEAVRKVNPEIIYAYSSGFGQQGPYIMSRTYDPIIQCLTGLAEAQGESQGLGKPTFVKNIIPDKGSAMTTCQGIIAALVAKARGFGGQKIELAMVDAVFSYIWSDVFQDYVWEEPGGEGAYKAGMPPKRQSPPIIDQLQAIEKKGPQKHLQLQDEALADERLAPFRTESTHLLLGTHVLSRYPAVFHGTPLQATPSAPMMGEHSRMVLQEALDFSDAEVDALVEQKVVCTTSSVCTTKPEWAASGKVFADLERCQAGPGVWATASASPTPVQALAGLDGHDGFGRAAFPAAAPGGTRFFGAAPAASGFGATLSEREKETMTKAGPLAGMVVLDASSMVAGPTCAMMLGDQGAEVWKLERPKGLDRARHLGPGPHLASDAMGAAAKDAMGAVFFALNRNKKSLLLDLEDAQDRSAAAALTKLLQKVDVVITDENDAAAEAPGVGSGLLSAAEAQRVNPRLVHLTVDRKVGELEAQAISGACALQREDGPFGNRSHLCTMNAEKSCGLYAAQSVCAALFAREMQGPPKAEGQAIRIGILESAFHFAYPDIYGCWAWQDPKGFPTAAELAETYKLTQTTDGRWVFLGANSGKEISDLKKCGLFTTPPEKEEQWSTQAGRNQDKIAFANQISQGAAKRSFAEMQKLNDEGDLVYGVARSRAEALLDEQVQFNETIETHDHPTLGRCRLARPVVRFGKTPQSIRSLAPLPGEHTTDVLRAAGVSEADLGALLLTKAAVQNGGWAF